MIATEPKCFLLNKPPECKERVLPIMAYTARPVARKGYLFQAQGIKKGRDVTMTG